MGRLVTRESEIGAAHRLEGPDWKRPSVVPCRGQRDGETLEPAQRHLGEQCVGVAEMPVWRRRAYAGQARCLGDGEAGMALCRDQRQRGFHQRLAQIAVVVTATLKPALGRPAHVTTFYIPGARTPAPVALGH
jgi:hypothetical protein